MHMTTMSTRGSLWRWQSWWPILVIVVPCTLLNLGGETVRRLLEYDRADILRGQWWRVFTGNFVHLGWSHLAEDMAGYTLLYLLLQEVLPAWRVPLLVVLGALGVGIGLLLADPHLSWYLGISGALNALWIAGAMRLMRQRDWVGWVLAVFLVAKLTYEQIVGPIPWSVATTGGPVAVDSHLYGAVTGAVLGLVMVIMPRSYNWPWRL